MNFILAKREDAIMVKFEDLRNQYINFCDGKAERFNDLVRMIVFLEKRFNDYLDLHDQHYIDNQGNNCPYLKLGVLDSKGQFKETSSFSYSDNLEINFALSLMIDRDKTAFPKENVIIPISIKKQKGAYIASLLTNGKIDKSFDVSSDDDAIFFYDAIAYRIMNTFDINQF